MAHKHDFSIGDAVNRMFASMVPHLELLEILKRILGNNIRNQNKPIIVSSRKRLSVNAKDLEELGDKKIIFHRVKSLRFTGKIPRKLFLSSILGIYNCNEVIFPDDIPKLMKLAKQKIFP